ncbi:alpha-amylase family glycosyl hydrolase [Caldisalinibacter kiritimatiensis]|uniref:Putative sucrose phosphorylase n=1 Tax=Caldisalinibacter kiritimatiensis TaxID=1304284 RepID=R1AX73_9FIRM|nr:alpha-amylase family glycosyl hydrolase [Caldisalinibacter kiritimatiensis]EOD01813.1 Putative sucrose phosphorylase [Caldisalinibacter kiritimatiensis]
MALVNITKNMENRIVDKLRFLYGEEKCEHIYDEIEKLINKFIRQYKYEKTDKEWVDEKDVYLITYGDNIRKEGKTPLKTLHKFLKDNLKGIITNVHILPFYPYSSDDGFSVIDYCEVNPDLGNWDDIQEMSKDFQLMFDAVINHISAKSNWFQGYLKGEEEYKDFFIETEPCPELSKVTRPRALPLLTEFETADGVKKVWTTFSADQIDLNFKNEKVLLKIIEVLLFYVAMGARTIRLDAIGYLWKKIGTSCIHLDETHKAIQLFRDILNIVAPETILITETNVPHKDNISYFGDGYNEAQMVYQFPLPPLVLNAYQTGNASHLLKWADSLEQISERTTFFNFLASHDGIGVMPAKGILSDEEIEDMVKRAKEYGGYVSYKDNGDGTKSPYELNINYFDALSHPKDDEDIKIKRFIGSQAILLSLIGVPAVYVHSLLGSRNYNRGVEESGIFRRINREKLSKETLESELANENSLRNKIFTKYCDLIKIRKGQKAFHPNAEQKVVFLNDSVFSFIRTSLDKEERILTLFNVSNTEQQISINLNDCIDNEVSILTDLVSDKEYKANEGIVNIVLKPYEFMWLKNKNK